MLIYLSNVETKSVQLGGLAHDLLRHLSLILALEPYHELQRGFDRLTLDLIVQRDPQPTEHRVSHQLDDAAEIGDLLRERIL